jgi:hypothetical protein
MDQGGRIAAAAAPPSIATGQASVASAEVARMRREARSANEVDMAAKVADAGAERSRDARRVGGRAFRDVGGAWVDVHHSARNSTIVVEPFSNAYFALLRALPELETYWKAMTSVTVAGKSTSIKVAAGGVKQLDTARITDIVKKFRS